MANYYELLNVNTDSSPAEIEAAIDEQYQKWNQLVTHHDPKVAAQANQAKQTLQEIRATLLDPAKRKVYDNAIGLGDTIGGLGDPEAILQAMSTPTGVPRTTNKVSSREEVIRERTDAWICPKCSKANPIGTTYCDKCGLQLAGVCPNCETLSELEKQYCPKCGCLKQEVFEEKKNQNLKNLNQEIKNLIDRKSVLQSDNYSHEYELQRQIESSSNKKVTAFILLFMLILPIPFLVTGYSDTGTSVYVCFGIPLAIIILNLFIRSSSLKASVKGQKDVVINNYNSQIQALQAKVKTMEDSFYKDGINIHELIIS